MKSKGEKVNDIETRIEQTIDRAMNDWMNDPRIKTSCNEHVAQEIVREFRLTMETVADMDARVETNGDLWFGEKTRIVGKWEH